MLSVAAGVGIFYLANPNSIVDTTATLAQPWQSVAELKRAPLAKQETGSFSERIAEQYAQKGEASGRIRLMIWQGMLSRMIKEGMWLGSGFAGPYLYDDGIGSAHSQYIDVLYRSGPIGLVLYLAVWFVVMRGAWRIAPELGCAMIALFIFGFVHETTKYSYVAFIFFALFSLSVNPERDKKMLDTNQGAIG